MYKPKVGEIICIQWDQGNKYGVVISEMEYKKQTENNTTRSDGFFYKIGEEIIFCSKSENQIFNNIRKSSKEEALSDLEERLSSLTVIVNFIKSLP